MASETKTSSSSASSSTQQQTTTSSSSSSSTGRVPLTLRDFFFQDPFFQTSWDDFDRIRRDMMRQSQEFWSRVQQDNLALESQMGKDNNSLLTTTPAPMGMPRRWMLPRLVSRDDSALAASASSLGQHDQLATAVTTADKMFPSDFFNSFRSGMEDSQVLRVKDDDAKFELSLDTHEYRPDELKVNVAGNTLTVEAKHEEKGENKFVSRQFSRKYTLPEGCEPHRVNSNLSSDGILMITAPKRQAIREASGDRPVPIEMKK